jgi:hypothetical protein
MEKSIMSMTQRTYNLSPVSDDPLDVRSFTLVVVVTTDDFKMYNLVLHHEHVDFSCASSAELEKDGWSYL